MERMARRMLALALIPGMLTLSGCERVLAVLSQEEKGIVVYCMVAVGVLLWLLVKVKYRGKKRVAAPSPREWQVAPPPQEAPAPAAPQPEPAPGPVEEPPVQEPVHEQAQEIKQEPAFGNPWWDIPAGTCIFIDTCVLMEAGRDRAVAAWFDHLKKYTRKQDWTIVILNSVIKELDGLKNSDDEERAQASRAATNLLGGMQRSLGSRFVITGANRTPADDEFEREMQEGDLLCTRDNNLALRINGLPGLQALGLMDFPRIPRTMRRA